MTDADPVRWGIISMANITRRFLPGIRAARNARLAAVASRQPEKATALQADQPDLRVYDRYETLLADPDVEAVYIPLPNTLHAEWAIKAAEAGKHVLCEKPLATTIAEVERMAAAARQHKTLLMEAFMWRFHPQHARVKELIASGEIGEPRLVRAGLSFSIDLTKPNIRLDPTMGGGAIWDAGCYAVSIARFIFEEEPERLSATAHIDPRLGVDLSMAAVVSFSGDRVAMLEASMEMAGRSMYEVVGARGSLRVRRVWTENDEQPQITITVGGEERIETLTPANHFQLEIEHLSDVARGRAALRYGPEDALAQIRALSAMRRAFASGCAEIV